MRLSNNNFCFLLMISKFYMHRDSLPITCKFKWMMMLEREYSPLLTSGGCTCPFGGCNTGTAGGGWSVETIVYKIKSVIFCFIVITANKWIQVRNLLHGRFVCYHMLTTCMHTVGNSNLLISIYVTIFSVIIENSTGFKVPFLRQCTRQKLLIPW